MSPNDPDLPVQDMPRMVPDREDIASRKVKKGSSDKKKPAEPVQKSTPAWIPMMLIILMGLSGYLVWQSMNMSEQLSQGQQDLQLSNARIKVLENQLLATGENLVVNEANIKAQFGSHMSEIRKLWDVSNKRNRGWIEQNQNAIKSVRADLGASASTVAQLGASSVAQQKRVNELEQSLSDSDSELSRSLDQAQTQIRQAVIKLDELTLEQSLLSDQLRTQNLDQVRTDLQNLSQNIDEISQDIASINNSRLQVNQRLTALQDQLIALESKILEPVQP